MLRLTDHISKTMRFLLAAVVLLGTIPAHAVVLDFNSTLQAGTSFAVVGTDYLEDGFKMSVFNGGAGLVTWESGSANFLTDPVIASGSSGTYLELTNDANNLFDVTSIDVVDFVSSQAAGNVGNQVTFYGIKPDNSVVSSTFSFVTTTFDKETHALPAAFTGLTKFTWNQNSAGEPPSPVFGAVANRVHMVDNIVVTDAGPAPPVPPGLPTIVAFGDSTTAPRSVGASVNGRPLGLSTQGANSSDAGNPPHNIVNIVNETSSMLYVYSDILRDELPGLGYNLEAVDNEGIGGNRTDQALARLNGDVRAKDPEVVIIQYGINDSWVDSGVPTGPSRVPLDAADQVGHPNASRGNYEDNLTSVVQTLQADGTQVIIMTPSPVSNTVYPAWRLDREELYAQAARNVAAAENVELVDIWQLYMEYDTQPGQGLDDLLVDSQHPGALGHRMTANALMGMLIPEPTSLVLLLLCFLTFMLALTHCRWLRPAAVPETLALRPPQLQ